MKNKYIERIYNGIIKENPTFVIMLGMCPTLATTTSATNGFGMGIERLLLVLESLGLSVGEKYVPDVYFAPVCDKARDITPALALKLRAKGLSVDYDIMDRGFKPQLKYANKTGVKYLVILGEDEIAKGTASVKDMQSGEQVEVAFSELEKYFSDKYGL